MDMCIGCVYEQMDGTTIIIFRDILHLIIRNFYIKMISRTTEILMESKTTTTTKNDADDDGDENKMEING